VWSEITDLFKARYTRTALAALIGVSWALSAHAAEVWKLNVEKSKFSSSANTLVMDRYTGKMSGPDGDAKGVPAPKKFLIISNGKLYLATDATAYDALSGNGARAVDYTRWKDMNIVEIGDNVRSVDFCGFSCQRGLPDNRMTLTFKAKGVDPRGMMGNEVVLNTK